MALRKIPTLLRSLAAENRGAMIVETAVVAPILILLALGGFEISQIVSRQHELQSGISEAEAIALAANAGATTDTPALESILEESLSLSDDEVTIVMLYRCNANTTLVDDPDSCGEDDVVSTYLRITLQDVYSPIWTKFGVSKPYNFNLVRTVQLA
jgi:hypothetical protein